MVQVSKQSVQQWMMFEYLAKKHRFQDTIDRFERKYGMSYAEFEKRIKATDKEVFDEWDDSIDWGAAHEFLRILDQKIRDVQNGDIEYTHQLNRRTDT